VRLEAARLNGKCTIQLIESLLDMVSNLTKKVTHLKNCNTLLKQETTNLHSVIEASPRLPSKYIPKEQCILPVEVSHKDVAYIERVPTAASSLKHCLQPLNCRTGMSLWLEFRPQSLHLYLIMTNLKPLRTERRQPPHASG
jgi:hypothetical protein